MIAPVSDIVTALFWISFPVVPSNRTIALSVDAVVGPLTFPVPDCVVKAFAICWIASVTLDGLFRTSVTFVNPEALNVPLALMLGPRAASTALISVSRPEGLLLGTLELLER